MQAFFLAFFAGLVTVTSPCILPVLPILLGSALKNNRKYPLYVVLGMASTFTLFGVLFGVFGAVLPFDRGTFHVIAIAGIGLMGIILMIPSLSDVFARLVSSGIARLGNKEYVSTVHQSGEAFLLGSFLGIVWAPCAGPILGSIILLASSTGKPVLAGALLFVYSLGAGFPMLLLAYGGGRLFRGRMIVQRYAERLRMLFGALLLVIAIFMATGILKKIELMIVPYAPIWSTQI